MYVYIQRSWLCASFVLPEDVVICLREQNFTLFIRSGIIGKG